MRVDVEVKTNDNLVGIDDRTVIKLWEESDVVWNAVMHAHDQ